MYMQSRQGKQPGQKGTARSKEGGIGQSNALPAKKKRSEWRGSHGYETDTARAESMVKSGGRRELESENSLSLRAEESNLPREKGGNFQSSEGAV
eukprot:6149474-Pleurochrysis_carterae.AAC.1